MKEILLRIRKLKSLAKVCCEEIFPIIVGVLIGCLFIQVIQPWIMLMIDFLESFKADYLLNKILWCVLWIIFGVFYGKVINWKYNVGIVIFYLILRLLPSIHSEWEFIRLYGNVYYLDIPAVTLILSCLTQLYLSKKQYAQDISIPEKYDGSICKKEDDRFGYYEDAELLVDKLMFHKDSYKENALIIGLEGEWGSGKSSFINMIGQVVNTGRYKLSFVNFSSWNYRDSNQLTVDLLSTIAEFIDGRDVKTAFDQYIKVFEGTSYQWIVNIMNALGKQSFSTQRYFDEVNNKLKKSDRVVIVAVDDIDRLVKNEVLEVLKLLRNTANFRNIIYIVAFDRVHVETSLKECGIHDPTSYLEKIFNVPFLLPIKDKDTKNQLYKDILQKNIFFNSNDKINAGINAFVDDFGEHISVRNIKKLAKQLLMNTSFIRKDGMTFDLDIYDSLILYYLNIKYKQIYEKLKDFVYDLDKIDTNSDGLVYKYNNYVFKNRVPNDKDKKIEESYIKEKIIPIVGVDSGVDTLEISNLITALFEFYQKGYEKTAYTIIKADVYPIFFTRKIPEDYIKSKDFMEESKKKTFPEKLKEWNATGKRSILEWVISYVKFDEYTEKEFIYLFEQIISIMTIESSTSRHRVKPHQDKTSMVIPGINCVQNLKDDGYLNAIKFVMSNTKYDETFSQRFSLLIQPEMCDDIYRGSFDTYLYLCNLYQTAYLNHHTSFDDFNYDFWYLISFLYERTRRADDIVQMQERCKEHILMNIGNFAAAWNKNKENSFLSNVFSKPEYVHLNVTEHWKSKFFEFIELHKNELNENMVKTFYKKK